MKKLHAAGLLFCGLLIAIPAVAKEAPKGKPPQPGVLARVGDETITEEEVQEILDRMDPRARPPDAKRRVLDNLVELNVFAVEAKKAGMANDPKVKKRLKEVTTVVLARSFYDRYVIGTVEVSDEAAREQYEKYKENYESPPQVNVKHIMVKDKAKAEEILARLKKGESFEELARAESKDPMSARNGGDLGWQSVKSLDPNFAKTAQALGKGGLSKVVQTRYGFHVIKLIDQKPKGIMTFEEVKGPIIESLKKQKIDELRAKYLEKADVEIFMPEETPAAAEDEETPAAAGDEETDDSDEGQ